jgi:hypothetical protein
MTKEQMDAIWNAPGVQNAGHLNLWARAFYVIDDAYHYATHNVCRSRVSKIVLNDCITCDRRTLFDATWAPESNAAARMGHGLTIGQKPALTSNIRKRETRQWILN